MDTDTNVMKKVAFNEENKLQTVIDYRTKKNEGNKR